MKAGTVLKKIPAMLMTLALSLSLIIPAFAGDEMPGEEAGTPGEYTELPLPEQGEPSGEPEREAEAGPDEGPDIRGGVRITVLGDDGLPVRGAEFGVVNGNPESVALNGTAYGSGEVCLILTSGENGEAVSDGYALPCGDYTLRQLEAPPGYTFDESRSSDFRIARHGVTVDLGSVLNTRIPEESGEILSGEMPGEEPVQEEEEPVPAPLISSLAGDGNGGKTVLVPDMSGTAGITDTVFYENLIPGMSYTVSGVVRNGADGGVLRRSDGEAYVAETAFVPENPYGSVTQTFSLPASRAAGKTLVISETLLCEGRTVAVHDDPGDVNQTVECRLRTGVYKYDASDHSPLEGAVLTVTDVTDKTHPSQTTVSGADGFAYFGAVPGHAYVISETQAPAGYIPDREARYTLRVLPDGTAEGDTEIPNAQGGTVIISKTDAVSGKYLPGCRITVFDGNRSAIFTQTTDERGRVYVSGLLPGTYYYRETAACAGYYLNPDEYSFSVSKEQLVSGDVHMENVPYGTAVIRKTDKSGNPLQGAQIAIYDSGGTLLGRGVSEKNGRVYFMSPGEGSYYFVEEAAPAGYMRNTDRHCFSIARDYTISGDLTVVNSRLSSNVSTGDNSGVTATAAACAVSMLTALGTYLLLRSTRKKKQEESV